MDYIALAQKVRDQTDDIEGLQRQVGLLILQLEALRHDHQNMKSALIYDGVYSG